jgi:tetratricopeptide (TPR) repeat protein
MLETIDQQHLDAAEGYVSLGMYEDANDELESITPDVRHVPEVLNVRIAIYRGTERWHAMAAVAARLVEWNPEIPGWFINLAYATRRTESVERAHHILLRAEKLHPKHGLIQFNLACYEAQLGKLKTAAQHLQQAIKLDANCKAMALADADLEPLWETIHDRDLD